MQYLDAQAAKFPPEVFRRRHLNMWVSGEGDGFPEGAWERLGGKDLDFDGDEIYAAVDLGLRHDTAAVAWASPSSWDDPDVPIRVGAMVWGLHYDPEKPPPPAHEIVEDTRLPIIAGRGVRHGRARAQVRARRARL